MRFRAWLPSKKQAGRIIDQLTKESRTPAEVAYLNGIGKEDWVPSTASVKQVRLLSRYGINAQGMTPKQASDAIERAKRGEPKANHGLGESLYIELSKIEGQGQLDSFREKLRSHLRELSPEDKQRIFELGKRKAKEVF
jgi:hypothetical protein